MSQDSEIELQPVIDSSFTRKAKDTAAGFAGGVSQVLIGQPFDLIKVRLQTGQFQSPIEAFTHTLKKEGPLAFYKGTAAPLFGVGACVSLQFYAFHEARRQLLKSGDGIQKELSYKQFYVAGASAGIANTFITAPVEQIRILLQTQGNGAQKIYNGPIDAIKKISKQSGVFKGLFRGFNVTLLREGQAYGVWFLTYEFVINQLIKRSPPGTERKDLPAWKLAASGALAGEALWLSSYPLDVIKSRLQSDGFGPDRKYTSAWAITKKTYSKEGLRAFWKGLGPTLARAVPASAGTFMTVELAMRVLG
ncbi:hepatocellular carcinoma down-regulated mitochondrial carrier protein [Nadsonia fulvescens var. elongata DSM 6958]|uniref:Hepatocellular carcinoma down-regulated mitochondrial carrier protein n=1 Tax=Nadsonia fulvescens var. elongata DSM 6958 TaxID=857566 RepID=A0A1E3PKF3_9ASCO|nr:hepatocellular carcinoma down-regulated mitochondrial carrier protein [Nadsonia fulvescens var. elongata DSM 6958]